MKTRRLVVDPQTGKISLSKSVPSCQRCGYYMRQVKRLEKQVGLLGMQNKIHRKRQEQMDILCSEITILKEKLRAKFSNKNDQIQRPCSHPSHLHSQHLMTQKGSKPSTDRLRPITVTSTNSQLSKQLTTNRTWALFS